LRLVVDGLSWEAEEGKKEGLRETGWDGNEWKHRFILCVINTALVYLRIECGLIKTSSVEKYCTTERERLSGIMLLFPTMRVSGLAEFGVNPAPIWPDVLTPVADISYQCRGYKWDSMKLVFQSR
jgi:hypothetical protein